MNDQQENGKTQLPGSQKPVKLTAEQIKRIEELLAEIEDYGELHLIVQHGDLRYVNKVESHNFWDLTKKKKR